MDIIFTPSEDQLRFILLDEPVTWGDEPVTGFHFYYDAKGRVVAFDIDEASKRVVDPSEVEFTQEEA